MGICPVCGEQGQDNTVGSAVLFHSKPFGLARCERCNVVHFEPMPTTEELVEHYSSSFYDYDNHKEEGRGMAFAERLKSIKPEGEFLDIGCSAGFFLHGIKNNCAWNVHGTEFGDDIVAFSREQLGLDIRQGEIYDVGYEADFFDFIHVEDVLEHVSDPIGFLKECARILKPGGTFHLSVPNGVADAHNVISYSKQHEKPAFVSAGHIFYFAPDTMEYMFKEAGLKVRSTGTYDFKKGLRCLGLLPRKKEWAASLDPANAAKDAPEAISPPTGQPGQYVRANRHSKLYYRWRYMKDSLRTIPGISRYGLAHLYTLRKK